MPNEAEARALLAGRLPDGDPVESLAEALGRDLGIPLVCVTGADEGCAVWNSGDVRRYPAHRLAIVDTAGGSDAFPAALAVHLTAGASIAAPVRHATAAASWAVTHAGALDAMPTRAEMGGHLHQLRHP